MVSSHFICDFLGLLVLLTVLVIVNLGDGSPLETNIRESRSAARNPNHKWPNAIVPFVYDPALPVFEKYIIFDAMREIHEKTCVKFQELQQNQTGKGQVEDFVFIKLGAKGSGCRSKVGRSGGMQTLTLESLYCFNHGTILHELVHVLGFYHEHSRPDRDEYVIVNQENIPKEQLPNFAKKPNHMITTLELPYEIDSITHYPSKTENGTAGGYTIQSKNPESPRIPPRRRLTQLDALKIRRYYNIKDTQICAVSPAECQKSGRFPCDYQYWPTGKAPDCIHPDFVCDQVKDCTDSSDERESLCRWKLTVYQDEQKDKDENKGNLKGQGLKGQGQVVSESGPMLTLTGVGNTCTVVYENKSHCDTLNAVDPDKSRGYRCIDFKSRKISALDSYKRCVYLYKEKDCRGPRTIVDPVNGYNVICSPNLARCRFGLWDLKSFRPCWLMDQRDLYEFRPY